MGKVLIVDIQTPGIADLDVMVFHHSLPLEVRVSPDWYTGRGSHALDRDSTASEMKYTVGSSDIKQTRERRDRDSVSDSRTVMEGIRSIIPLDFGNVVGANKPYRVVISNPSDKPVTYRMSAAQ